MPTLRAIEGSAGPSRLVLVPGTLELGRDPEAELYVANPSLSRRHVRFEIRPNLVEITDLGSKNGTLVNGFRIAGTVPLAAGDRVRIGQLEYVFEDEELSSEASGSLDPQALNSDSSKPVATLVGKAQAGSEADRLQLMLRVAEELGRPMDLNRLLQRILELTAEILDADRLVLLRQLDGELVPVTALNAGERVEPTDSSRPWSRSIARRVAQRRLALRFSDTRRDARLTDASSVHTQDIRCAMGAPLVDGDAIFGVLYVDNRVQARAFTDLDLELLAGVANQAALAIRYARLREEREHEAIVVSTLRRFFPPTTVRRLLEQPELDLQPKEVVVTALFCDIVGFTDLCSGLSPLRVHTLLNAYFPRMVAAVQAHEGTVEKYIGDALLAVWGAPFEQAHAADRALAAAFEMRRALCDVNSELTEHGLPEIEVYIGLHTGPVAFGSVGADAYLQLATVGDTTNVAARVCDVAEPGQILLTTDTVEALSEPADLGPRLQRLVKGKAQPIDLFEATAPPAT